MQHGAGPAARLALLLLGAGMIGTTATVTASGMPIGSAARSGDPAVRLVRPSSVAVDVDLRAAHALVDAVNTARVARGLAPLRWDDRAASAASVHAHDIAAMGAVVHLGSDGSDGGQRLTRAGATWSSWGEALGAGFAEAASMVDAWVASPGHRAVLFGAFTRVGAGVATSAAGTPYWALVALT
jgi:uncharacterized protein YkwD